jgi:hypothetical protein
MSSYISEVAYRGSSSEDFIEVAVPAGTDVSTYSIVIYNSTGSNYDTYSFPTLTTSIAGTDVYLFNASTGFGALSNTNAIALVDNTGTVLQFISYSDSTTTTNVGPASGMNRAGFAGG